MTIIRQGADVWNSWRIENARESEVLNLEGANLEGANLEGANLDYVNLSHAYLKGVYLRHASLKRAVIREANLDRADLVRAKLTRADLTGGSLNGAKLDDADLRGARLRGANLAATSLERTALLQADLMWADLTGSYLGSTNLSHANLDWAILERVRLIGTNLIGASLKGANLKEAFITDAIFADVNLTGATGLDSCYHSCPSTVDHRTLAKSKNLPFVFWRGCGLPEILIDYTPSLPGQEVKFHSCFISYSSKDQEFAERLHADLQDNSVRCWFAPHDLAIGAKTWDGIYEAIRTKDKVLLILSEDAIKSDWVEDEVTAAFAEERRREALLLFPVRLDDTVMETNEPWAGKLRDNRNIGDFSRWKDHDSYKATFKRILRDLRAGR